MNNMTRLGDAVRHRRDALSLSQEEVAELGGPSTTTLSKIENGTAVSIRRRTREDLERVLRWRGGSVDRLLEGGDATPVDAAPPAAPAAPFDPAGVTRLAVRAAESASNTLLALNAGEIDVAKRHARDAQVRTMVLGMALISAEVSHGDLEQVVGDLLAGGSAQFVGHPYEVPDPKESDQHGRKSAATTEADDDFLSTSSVALPLEPERTATPQPGAQSGRRAPT